MIRKKEIKSIKATILRLPPETHKLLRIAAIEAGISMNDAINQALQLWLAELEKARKAVRK